MDINPLNNLRLAYEELERRVQRALNTQVGDDERLVEVQEEVLSYIQAVEQVCRITTPPVECNDINLENSTHTSSQLRSFHIAGRMLSP
jgi:hypothetical protein